MRLLPMMSIDRIGRLLCLEIEWVPKEDNFWILF